MILPKPSDPDLYREDHATNLYPASESPTESGVPSDASGWVIYHPEDQDARLVRVIVENRTWER